MIYNKKINDKVYWDDVVLEAFNLDSNVVSLETLTTKLKKDKILKGNFVRLDDDLKKILLKTSTYKTASKIRINIFLSYLLSNYSVSNTIPNCYYCSYNKDFKEIPDNDLNKILKKFEV